MGWVYRSPYLNLRQQAIRHSPNGDGLQRLTGFLYLWKLHGCPSYGEEMLLVDGGNYGYRTWATLEDCGEKKPDAVIYVEGREIIRHHGDNQRITITTRGSATWQGLYEGFRITSYTPWAAYNQSWRLILYVNGGMWGDRPPLDFRTNQRNRWGGKRGNQLDITHGVFTAYLRDADPWERTKARIFRERMGRDPRTRGYIYSFPMEMEEWNGRWKLPESDEVSDLVLRQRGTPMPDGTRVLCIDEVSPGILATVY